MSRVFTRCLYLLLLPLALLVVPVQAQDDGQSLDELLSGLEQSLSELRELSTRIEQAPERNQEVLAYRKDERIFLLLEQLSEVVNKAASLPEDDPARRDVTLRLEDKLAAAGSVVAGRITELRQRIIQQRVELDSLSGGDKVTREAFINTLERLRFKFYAALLDVVDARKSLGLSTGDFATSLGGEFFLHAETLVGRVDFTGKALSDVGQRLKADPENADLKAARQTLSASQSLNLEYLQTVVDLIERLDLDATTYKSVLLKESHVLSVSTLEKGALITILQEEWKDLRRAMSDKAPQFILNLFVFIVILLFFRMLSKLVKRAVRAACERRGEDMSTLLKDVTVSLSGGTVMGIGILIALAQVGISLGPMLAGLGVAGFIVGFALQDTLGNFAAGGMILLYRPYDVDDLVSVSGVEGFVKKMSLVSTTITTIDNQTLVVPNSKIWGDVIKNVTAQKVRRVDMVFGISYSDDIEHAERVLEAILEEHDKVLSKPAAVVKVHELGDSSVNFVVRPWVRTADYWDVHWDVTRAVKMRFDSEGISIPFPQRDVHLYPEDS